MQLSKHLAQHEKAFFLQTRPQLAQNLCSGTLRSAELELLKRGNRGDELPLWSPKQRQSGSYRWRFGQLWNPSQLRLSVCLSAWLGRRRSGCRVARATKAQQSNSAPARHKRPPLVRSRGQPEERPVGHWPATGQHRRKSCSLWPTTGRQRAAQFFWKRGKVFSLAIDKTEEKKRRKKKKIRKEARLRRVFASQAGARLEERPVRPREGPNSHDQTQCGQRPVGALSQVAAVKRDASVGPVAQKLLKVSWAQNEWTNGCYLQANNSDCCRSIVIFVAPSAPSCTCFCVPLPNLGHRSKCRPDGRLASGSARVRAANLPPVAFRSRLQSFAGEPADRGAGPSLRASKMQAALAH